MLLDDLMLGSRLNTPSGSGLSAYSTFRSRATVRICEEGNPKSGCRASARIFASHEYQLTCYHANLLRILSADQENNVSLAGIDVVILQEERFVDAIFLKIAELDDQANSASQRLLDDQILLSAELVDVLSVLLAL